LKKIKNEIHNAVDDIAKRDENKNKCYKREGVKEHVKRIYDAIIGKAKEYSEVIDDITGEKHSFIAEASVPAAEASVPAANDEDDEDDEDDEVDKSMGDGLENPFANGGRRRRRRSSKRGAGKRRSTRRRRSSKRRGGKAPVSKGGKRKARKTRKSRR